MPRKANEDIIADIPPEAWRAARGAALCYDTRGDTDHWEPWPGMNANIGHPVDASGNYNWDARATLDNLVVTRADMVEVSRRCANRIRMYCSFFGTGALSPRVPALLRIHLKADRGATLSLPNLLRWAELLSFVIQHEAQAPYPAVTAHQVNKRKRADIGLAYADLHVMMHLLDGLIAENTSNV